MAAERFVMRVDAASHAAIRAYAAEKSIGLYEAADALVALGAKRRAAWNRYTANRSNRKSVRSNAAKTTEKTHAE